MRITIDPGKYGTRNTSLCFRLSAAGLRWKQKCISSTELSELLSQGLTSFVLHKDKSSEKKNAWYFNQNISATHARSPELQGRLMTAHRGQAAWRCSGATSVTSAAPLILSVSSSNSPASAGGSVLLRFLTSGSNLRDRNPSEAKSTGMSHSPGH